MSRRTPLLALRPLIWGIFLVLPAPAALAEVDFASELGRGSTFWVTLPFRLSDRRPLRLATPGVTGIETATVPH